MSDYTTPPSSGGPAYTPPPAAPAQPYQAYPGAAPAYPPAGPGQAPAAVPPAPGAVQPYGAPSGYGAAPAYGAAPGYAAPQGYAPGAYPLYAAPRPTSGLAVTSLVCGLASFLLSWLFIPALASIVAVITGHMALKRTKEDPSLGGRGMAYAGLIIGYVVIGIGVLTVGIIVASFFAVGAFTLPWIYAS
ncbi:DUF4190 domain-containing protein [uncultured Microbacterium sp.]|uniref:DUF4190 domain-containing protein n=1 Tax=uncultured Microbacterium sp. TaxID=191216 RepID=UPI0028DC81DA|nr:DUF4190 domain-containing protein [uncultured Microbacterium sp.]